MRLLFRWQILLCLLLISAPAWTQQAAPPQMATVTFKFHWDKGQPWTDYTITVAENGATHFSGIGSVADHGNSDSFQQDFQMTEAGAQRIFRWAKAANYFQGEFDAREKHIAQTGMKTLEYSGASIHNSTTYNFSPNQNIQQVTKYFQAISVTIDYGRKLAFQYRFDKLGMDTCLNELTDLQASGMAEQLQAIEPILQKIANDSDVMHIARLEARQLLKSAGVNSGSSNQGTSRP